jgi:signal transduction histidine kinase
VVDVAARDAHRLLAMVETLLDCSQVEAGRLHAHLELVYLAALDRCRERLPQRRGTSRDPATGRLPADERPVLAGPGM